MVNTRLFGDLSVSLTKRRTDQDNSDKKLERAEEAFHTLRRDGDAAGFVDPAHGLFNKTIAQADLLNKGRKAIGRRDYEGAIAPLEEAVELNGSGSGVVQAEHALGGAYFGAALSNAPEFKERGFFGRLFNKILPRNEKGKQLDTNLFFGKAIEKLDAVIAKDSKHAEAYFLRGRVAMEKSYNLRDSPVSDDGLSARVTAISDFKSTVDLNQDRELTTEALHQAGQTYEELHGLTREARRLTDDTESGEYSVINVDVGEDNYQFIVPAQFGHFEDVTADVTVQTAEGIEQYVIEVNPAKVPVVHEKVESESEEEAGEEEERPPVVPRAGTIPIDFSAALASDDIPDGRVELEPLLAEETSADPTVSVTYKVSTIGEAVEIYEAASQFDPKDVHASTRVAALVQDVHTEYDNRDLFGEVEKTSVYDGVREKVREGFIQLERENFVGELFAYQSAAAEFAELTPGGPVTDEERKLAASIKQNVALASYNNKNLSRHETLARLQEARDIFPEGPEVYAAIKEIHLHNVEANKE